MNKQKLLLAIAIAVFTTSGFAKPKDDEDSVYSWGPWEVLVKPAAGLQIPVSTILAGPVAPGFGSGDASSFTPMVIQESSDPTVTQEASVEGRCVAGSACGYAFIFGAVLGAKDSPASSLQAATPILTPVPVSSDNTSLTVNSNTNVSLSESIANVLVTFSGNSWSYINTVGNFVRLRGTTIDVAGIPFAHGESINVGLGAGSPITGTSFVYGESTGLDDLNALNAGNTQATYSGVSLGSQASVDISVDFGAATWGGKWNAGADTGVITETVSSDNVKVISGKVGFNASGTLNGANIVSTSVTAEPGTTISGTVNASFFGGGAGVLAGAVDITKTTNAYTGGVYRDLFVTEKVVLQPEN